MLRYVPPATKSASKLFFKPKQDNYQLEVFYFEPTQGLDEETCKVFNEYTARLRDNFSQRMETLASLNAKMEFKLQLFQNEKNVSELTALELVGMAFLRGESALKLWQEFKRNCPDSVLRDIA